MAIKEYTLKEVKEKADEYIKIRESNNENTATAYKNSIKYFIHYLENIIGVKRIGTKSIILLLEGFQGALINGFEYNNREIQSSPSSTNTHIRRVKTFLKKCLGLTASEVKQITIKNKTKYKALPTEHIKLMLDECSNKFKNEETAVRNRCLIKFMFNTAFRVSEALSLTTDNLYGNDEVCYVRVHEKGTEKNALSDPIEISKSDYDDLQYYISIKKTPSEFVFSTRTGKALSRQYFNRDVKLLGAFVDEKHGTNISEVLENNSSHVFRHSKGRALLKEDKVDIMDTKSFLRHSAITSTQIYLESDEDEVNKLRRNSILE